MTQILLSIKFHEFFFFFFFSTFPYNSFPLQYVAFQSAYVKNAIAYFKSAFALYYVLLVQDAYYKVGYKKMSVVSEAPLI